MKLTPDLVPSTCWFSNLRSELPRSEWDRLRKASYRAARLRCEICGGRGDQHPVECHERWSYVSLPGGKNIQRLAGLISLCPACHEVKHIGLAQARGRLAEAMIHIAKVNGISGDEAIEVVDQASNEWEERSKYEWSLDVTWLLDHGVNPALVEKAHRGRSGQNDDLDNEPPPRLPKTPSRAPSETYRVEDEEGRTYDLID